MRKILISSTLPIGIKTVMHCTQSSTLGETFKALRVGRCLDFISSEVDIVVDGQESSNGTH